LGYVIIIEAGGNKHTAWKALIVGELPCPLRKEALKYGLDDQSHIRLFENGHT
jgi:hypothetical protein